MKNTCLLALMVLASATAVNAADNDKNDDSKTTASDQKPKSDKDPNKVVCRTDRATGSLTRVNRICHTRAEWEQLAQETKKNMNDLQRRSNQGSQSDNP